MRMLGCFVSWRVSWSKPFSRRNRRCSADDDVMRQVQAWQRDSLLHELRSVYRQEQASNPISGGWIVATSPALSFDCAADTRESHRPWSVRP